MATISPAKASGKKSGIKILQQGEIMFSEKDPAQSLFIIQSGQVRLFRPKGRGFVDLAILRAGEVIGEMAYFDDKAGRRSCSASALVRTEVIEISFKAFEKTMSGLNPWFKTIINTLANRLRQTNEKVKNLESNSVSFGKDGHVGQYKFFQNADVVKILALIYLAFKTHSEEKDGKHELHSNKLKFYILDVMAIPEVKLEEFMNLLRNEQFLEIAPDEDNLPRLIQISNLDRFRSMLVFFNTQRTLTDDKQLDISGKCEKLLKKILDQLVAAGGDSPKMKADITVILDDFKSRNVPITEEDLRDAVKAGIAEDLLVGAGNNLSSVIDLEKLKKLYPSIKLMNSIASENEDKAKGS